MSNKDIWDKFKQPPKHALKTIGGGRLKGMTDINPQWRLEAMTEAFGPCGIGWKYEIVELWPIHLDSGEATAFSKINLYIKHNGEWSEPIPGIGGSMLVAKETSGLKTSDEAYKMATTDALSVAMKALGIAADIYAGLWDGSKYREIQPEHRFKPGEKEEIVKQVLECLDAGDGEGLKQILSEYKDPEEKMKVWALFNSTQRAAIKQLTGH